jgi:hypothetical protein
MTTPVTFDKSLIAPCGINCGTCFAFLRDKNKCNGCVTISANKPKTRLCIIRNCEHRLKTTSGFCYDCEKFPCKRLKQLNERYWTKYKANLVQNLLTIKELGMTNYLKEEINKWTCPDCGSVISVHKDNCIVCNRDLNKNAL